MKGVFAETRPLQTQPLSSTSIWARTLACGNVKTKESSHFVAHNLFSQWRPCLYNSKWVLHIWTACTTHQHTSRACVIRLLAWITLIAVAQLGLTLLHAQVSEWGIHTARHRATFTLSPECYVIIFLEVEVKLKIAIFRECTAKLSSELTKTFLPWAFFLS